TRLTTPGCSVFRMPLAEHRSSVCFGFGAFTTLLRPTEISRRGAGIQRSPWSATGYHLWSGQIARRVACDSSQIAPKDQRSSAVRGRVVALSAADLAKSRASVEPPRRHVALLHFEEHRARAEAG